MDVAIEDLMVVIVIIIIGLIGSILIEILLHDWLFNLINIFNDRVMNRFDDLSKGNIEIIKTQNLIYIQLNETVDKISEINNIIHRLERENRELKKTRERDRGIER